MTIKDQIEYNLYGKFVYFPKYIKGMDVIHREDVTSVNSHLNTDMFNIVCNTRFTALEAEKRVDEILKIYAAEHLPFAWWIGPNSTPRTLGKILTDKGFKKKNEEVGMAIEEFDTDFSPCPLQIEEVLERRGVDDFCNILAEYDTNAPEFYRLLDFGAYEPAFLYVGYVDGEPIVTGSLFFTEKVCGIFDVLTRLDHHKQGYGAAMTYFLASEAKRLGASLVSLSASSQESRCVYEKLGFHPYCHFEVYTWNMK
ncbi:MAG: GNAT family N-acetyltransferase [Chlamydiales bacterium]